MKAAAMVSGLLEELVPEKGSSCFRSWRMNIATNSVAPYESQEQMPRMFEN